MVCLCEYKKVQGHRAERLEQAVQAVRHKLVARQRHRVVRQRQLAWLPSLHLPLAQQLGCPQASCLPNH